MLPLAPELSVAWMPTILSPTARLLVKKLGSFPLSMIWTVNWPRALVVPVPRSVPNPGPGDSSNSLIVTTSPKLETSLTPSMYGSRTLVIRSVLESPESLPSGAGRLGSNWIEVGMMSGARRMAKSPRP